MNFRTKLWDGHAWIRNKGGHMKAVSSTYSQDGPHFWRKKQSQPLGWERSRIGRMLENSTPEWDFFQLVFVKVGKCPTDYTTMQLLSSVEPDYLNTTVLRHRYHLLCCSWGRNQGSQGTGKRSSCDPLTKAPRVHGERNYV